MDFDKVGRLQPIQSTRGFGLAGQPYFFQPPIKPKPKKRPKRRAKGGKIIYDNKRAKYFREVEMGLRQRRRPRLHRNTTNPSSNPYDHIGRDDSIVRPDGISRDVVIKIEQGLEKRLDRDVEEIEDIVERRIAQHRDKIRRQVPEVPLLEDRGIRRAPQIEGGRPIDDGGVIALEPPPVIQLADKPRPVVEQPPPELQKQQEEARIEEVEEESVKAGGSVLGVDDPRLLVEREPAKEDPSPLRERPSRLRQNVPVVSYAESEASRESERERERLRQEKEERDDPDFTPSPQRRKKKGQKAVVVEESDFLEQQLALQKEAEERRLLQIRRDKEELAKRDKAESESFRLQRGGSGGSAGFDVAGDVNSVSTAEREVNRVDDEPENKRGFLSRFNPVRAFSKKDLQKGLARPEGEPDVEPVFQQPQNNPIDNPMLGGVGGVLYNTYVPNPMDAPSVASTDLSSDITTDALGRVLAGGRATDIDQQTTIPEDPSEYQSSIAQD